MPNSLKARLKKLKYQGSLSEEDLDRIVVLPSEETYDKCVRLDDLLEMIERFYEQGNVGQLIESMGLAIKALKQEPCEDAISRQAAQAKIKSICDEYRLSYEDGERKAATGGSAYALGHAFDDLPPVTPQPKMGRWILADEQNKEDVENDNYRFICSECQCSDIHAKDTIVPYCWKCGAKMIEPQESEGKR